MNRFSLTTYGILTVLGVGSVVIVNFWISSQLNEPIPTAPAIVQPKAKLQDPARPPLDENGMLVPIGAPVMVQPAPDTPKAVQSQEPATPPKKIYEGPMLDSTGDLAG